MEIDFTQVLLDLDEKPAKKGGTGDDKDEPVTLAYVCEMALLANSEKVNKLTGEKKCHRAVIAHDIHRNGKVDIMAEDIVMLKEAVADVFNPLIIMRAFGILDPKPKPDLKAVKDK